MVYRKRNTRGSDFPTGESGCADSLAQCYTSGKPALAVPCYGEGGAGSVAADELPIALRSSDVERALSGTRKLSKIGFKYPIDSIGGVSDVAPVYNTVQDTPRLLDAVS